MENALIPLLVIGTIASIWDLRTGRIPNALTFGAALVAIVVRLVVGGPAAAGWAMVGWAVGCALFMPVYLLGGMGAGDVKLLAAIGAWVGPMAALKVAFFSTLAGGVLAIVVALARGYLRQALSNVWLLLCHWRVMGLKPLDEVSLQAASGSPRLAYGLAITAGSMAWLWMK